VKPLSAALLVLLLGVGVVYAESPQIDTARSTVTVQVYKSGLFSGFAHNHIIKAPIASGTIDTGHRAVQLSFNAADMKVADTEGSESEHQEIEATMKGPKVLDTAQFPVISFNSKSVEAAGPQQYKITGELKLHGVSRELSVPVSLSKGTYNGSVNLKQTDYGITPVKIAGGAVRVKDEIEISFEIVPR
jgi:polyisoprenoid-binding protein YceI